MFVTLKNFKKMFYQICFVSMCNLWHEKSVFQNIFAKQKSDHAYKRFVHQLMTSKNFSFDRHKLSSVLLSFCLKS